MFIQPQFKYRHQGGERMPVDVRRNRKADIALTDCLFLGFRLRDADGERYHHSWIIADGYEPFMYGVYLERDRILSRYPRLVDADVDLVHVQSLQFRNMPISDANVAMITQEVHQAIAVQNDSRFVFLGFEPEAFNIVMSSVDVLSAKAAVQQARNDWEARLGRYPRILAVLQANPVVKELHELFSMEAVVMESLVSRSRHATLH